MISVVCFLLCRGPSAVVRCARASLPLKSPFSVWGGVCILSSPPLVVLTFVVLGVLSLFLIFEWGLVLLGWCVSCVYV